jgi:hypothetical protein
VVAEGSQNRISGLPFFVIAKSSRLLLLIYAGVKKSCRKITVGNKYSVFFD